MNALDRARRPLWNARAMKQRGIWLVTLVLAGCGGGPLFWPVDDPGTTKPKATKTRPVPARAPLEVPPELRGELVPPMPDAIAKAAAAAGELPSRYRKLVAGKAVRLNARAYPVDAAKLFSATVDAMTSLNLPVAAVDSPSGIITTDWVRNDANTTASFSANLFGGGVRAYRYRYVVRVMRVPEKANESVLEVRTLGQVYVNKHWVNRPLKRRWKRSSSAPSR
ncbi:MAG: outer membrane protein assembly factor BamC, partial [Zetaproteobacteria bacterium]